MCNIVSFFSFSKERDLLAAWESGPAKNSYAPTDCRERYYTYQYGMGTGSMQGRLVEGPLLGGKWDILLFKGTLLRIGFPI